MSRHALTHSMGIDFDQLLPLTEHDIVKSLQMLQEGNLEEEIR